MTRGHTPESLVAFRDRVAQAFRDKRIRAPVHFPGGNEAQVIEAFRDFRPGVDWLCSNWRNMYHCLLAGMPEEELFGLILEGRSMYPMSAARRIVCSSIVGGVLPIACGLAMGIRRRGGAELVFVAVGDMTARTGLYHEFAQYAVGHGLPVRVVEEDNGYSTNAPTEEVWGPHETRGLHILTRYYRYQRTMPHVGLPDRINFF